MASSSPAASVHSVAAAFSIAAAMIPAALAPLRYEVEPTGHFSKVSVAPFDPAALPLLLSSGSGHVVAVRQSDGKPAVLEEIGIGVAPRTVARLAGGLAQPSVGTDAKGRVVAVVRPCAPLRQGGPARSCDLAVYDLQTGAKHDLPGSRGATLGDLDHGRAVQVRGTSVRVDGGGGPPIAMPASAAIKAGTGGDGDPWEIDTVDLSGGSLAISATALTEAGSDSLVLAARVGTPWTTLDRSATGGAAQGSRDFSGVQVTPTGVVGYLDGAGDAPSYAARWGLDGTLLRKVSGGEIGTRPFVPSSAFVGDAIITAGFDQCDAECGILAAGPVGLG